ncbi:integral membrane protein [Listeria cornellensis FSL F6-0969]|uniref:Integral membrane protein n=1 Tax=Listeria cornellensis FSL F6-0969 TaxID=1265820 RepID=W7BXN2_9LIST|nr:integral membrane protein [Listeria cornellensis FSL F6-0969]
MKNSTMSQKLNILRAGVLGANDGIVSVAGIVIGVAGATTHVGTIFIAGIAGLVAGALSMAGGEYVSVSTQKDTEEAVIVKEKMELANDYDGELEELADIYIEKGLSADLAKQVAAQLMEKDALAAHSEAELGLQLNDFANPWQAALSSLFFFFCWCDFAVTFNSTFAIRYSDWTDFCGGFDFACFDGVYQCLFRGGAEAKCDCTEYGCRNVDDACDV